MKSQWLVDIDLRTIPTLRTDVVIVGGGIAGLAAALKASEKSDVLVLTKGEAKESNTLYAQGGIAAVLDKKDTFKGHIEDTLRAGGELCDKKMVELLVSEGALRVKELIDMGVMFDRDKNKNLCFTREGGHQHRRILHSQGDSTGKEIERGLLATVAEKPNIHILEHHFAVDILHHKKRAWGILAFDKKRSAYIPIEAQKGTILAGGGLGQLYRETTNPEIATGDALAMAYRAGANLIDMEFVQFHPTTLYLAGAPRFLISEAVRGEGAYLVDATGKRFMDKYDHERKELAPRDIVSQSILRFMQEQNASCVYLDLRHLDSKLVETRFPMIRSVVAKYGLNLSEDLIPVRPAEHYMMGGIETDKSAQTTVERLYASGECAGTRVHGANRLASNSLLEGLVFGHIAGEQASKNKPSHEPFPLQRTLTGVTKTNIDVDIWDLVASLKAAMTRYAGPFRTSAELAKLMQSLEQWHEYIPCGHIHKEQVAELKNMATVATLIAKAASLREESRGGHQRLDFPNKNDDWKSKSIKINRENYSQLF